jgi:hypothetical protein
MHVKRHGSMSKCSGINQIIPDINQIKTVLPRANSDIRKGMLLDENFKLNFGAISLQHTYF